MVKDMATFEWNSAQLEHSNVNHLSKKLSVKEEENETSSKSVVPTKKQITFENVDHVDQTLMSKSRSLSAARGVCMEHAKTPKVATSSSRPNLFLHSSTLASRSSSRSSSAKIINILGKDIIKLPVELECEIKIRKKFDPLGIQSVDCNSDEGVNGCIVLRIEPNTACARDARLKSGDYLLSVNNEQMRNLTNATAKGILNRASLTSSDVV